MKRVTKEKIETIFQWEAVDGTVFTSEEECKEYEQSARGVLRGKLKGLIVNDKYSEWELLGGNDDNTVIAVKVPTQEAQDIVLQNYYLDNPWVLSEGQEDSMNRILNSVKEAYEKKDLLILGLSLNGALYLIGTRLAIIDRLNWLDK